MMRANVLSGLGGNLVLEELRNPEPLAGEVLIRVAACGVCHSDLHVIKGEVPFPVPCVLGHEVSGVVEAVGAGVTHVAHGDRVVTSFIMPCGTCRHCVLGHDELCETFFSMNRGGGVLYDGTTRLYRPGGDPISMYSTAGLAELCVTPATNVFLLPGNLPLVDSAVLGCSVFTSVGAVRNVGRVGPGDTVAVVATGGVGLNIIQVAAAFGASTIIAIDLVPEKLELALALGATHAVNSGDVDHIAQVRAITGGRGVDVAFEALGNPRTIDTAIRVTDEGGRVVLVGIAPSGMKAEFDITHVVRRRISILGSYGGRTRTDMPLVLELAASGRIDVTRMITDRFPFEQTAEAYAKLARGEVLGRAVIDMGLVGGARRE